MSRRNATYAEFKAAESSSGLGGFVRQCNQCHANWELGQAACPKCGSLIFDERFIEPVPFERGPLGTIQRILQAPKPKVLPLAAEDAAVLKQAAEAGRVFVLALTAADQVAARAVNDSIGTRETIGYLRAKLLDASAAVGDFSIENLQPLVWPVLAVSELIETTLTRLEEETKQ
jgi:hypothetical protein